MTADPRGLMLGSNICSAQASPTTTPAAPLLLLLLPPRWLWSCSLRAATLSARMRSSNTTLPRIARSAQSVDSNTLIEGRKAVILPLPSAADDEEVGVEVGWAMRFALYLSFAHCVRSALSASLSSTNTVTSFGDADDVEEVNDNG